MKKIITLSIMFVLAITLGVLYFVQTRPETPSNEFQENIAELPMVNLSLIRRDESSVEGVLFIAGNGNEIYGMFPVPLETGIMWRWGDNPEYLLDPQMAREVVRPAWELTAVAQLHENTENLDLSEFGLDPPLLTMIVNYTDSSISTIRLGSTTADRRHNFIMIDDDPAIYLIITQIAQRMQATLGDILDRTPVAFHGVANYMKIIQPNRMPVELMIIDEVDSEDDPFAFIAGTGFLAMLQPFRGRGVHLMDFNTTILEPFHGFRIGDTVAISPPDLSPFGLDIPSLEFIYHSDFGELHLKFGYTFFDENDISQIYVKLADRPHVFKSEFEHVSHLMDINIFHFIDRFIALIPIGDVEWVEIDAQDPSRRFNLQVNHDLEVEHLIHPTINNVPVQESTFRSIYQHIVGLTGDAAITQFTPQVAPEYTITYHRINAANTELRFFIYDANFFAVSLDGEDPWFVTSRRDIELLFQRL